MTTETTARRDDRLLEGRVALITGSASGQGRAAALRFAAHGAAIAIVDIDDAGSAETARQVEALGAEAAVILRRYDEQAKVAGLATPPVAHFMASVAASLRG